MASIKKEKILITARILFRALQRFLLGSLLFLTYTNGSRQIYRHELVKILSLKCFESRISYVCIS